MERKLLMKQFLKIISFLTLLLLLTSCVKEIDNSQNAIGIDNRGEVLFANYDIGKSHEEEAVKKSEIFSLREPNETGKIMVVVFHKFVETFIPEAKNDGSFTTTLESFRRLLENLYNKGYRLINLNDYINNNISVPRGFIPIAFTFDDGTECEFNLIEDSGKLRVNKKTAVGVMEEFYETHPDFGLKGTFYVNLGLDTFKGKGTLSESLRYLISKGFEIGNHTLTHINLQKTENEEIIKKEIGSNQKRMYELVPGYTMTTFALPYGLSPKRFSLSLIKGEYEGVQYENKGIMKVAWDPMVSPTDKSYDPLNFKRVLSAAMTPSEGDLDWWLKTLTVEEQYISDGNPDAVTVPLDSLPKVDLSKLKGKRLIIN
jgi:peptidoglycan/xylan/chitin deacetylase (PgdA/CDA1 family)